MKISELVEKTLKGETSEQEFINSIMNLDGEQTYSLLKEYGFYKYNGSVIDAFRDLTSKYPEIVSVIRSSIKIGR